ncbi:MAG: hypothetical protein WEB58_20520, partial [Planctomycetaceae bacterium]
LKIARRKSSKNAAKCALQRTFIALCARRKPFSLREKVAEGRMRAPSDRKNDEKVTKNHQKRQKSTLCAHFRVIQCEKSPRKRHRVRNRTHDTVSPYEPLTGARNCALRTHVIACM